MRRDLKKDKSRLSGRSGEIKRRKEEEGKSK